MGSKAVFLDVDPSIVENNLRLTNNEEEEQFNKMLTEASYPSKVVKPSPGFCVKTKELITDTKVFVNICKTDAIPPPKDITTDELTKIIESEGSTDYKVPMSIGEIRTETDGKGQAAKACDVAIHPKFFKKVDEIQEFRNFFVAVVFHGLENKYGLQCSEEKIILKYRKAFGTLQTHRIQQREVDEKMKAEGNSDSILSKITGEKENQKKVVIETLSSTENVFREPEYRLYKKKNGSNCLYGEFKLPDVISAKELTLDIGEDRILLESKSRGYLLDIFLPYIVKQRSCTSTFSTTTKILSVTMPLVGG